MIGFVSPSLSAGPKDYRLRGDSPGWASSVNELKVSVSRGKKKDSMTQQTKKAFSSRDHKTIISIPGPFDGAPNRTGFTQEAHRRTPRSHLTGLSHLPVSALSPLPAAWSEGSPASAASAVRWFAAPVRPATPSGPGASPGASAASGDRLRPGEERGAGRRWGGLGGAKGGTVLRIRSIGLAKAFSS